MTAPPSSSKTATICPRAGPVTPTCSPGASSRSSAKADPAVPEARGDFAAAVRSVVGGSAPSGAAQGGKVIRVLVAEDMRILRDTLVAVLNLEDDIDVVAQVADGEAIVPAAV